MGREERQMVNFPMEEYLRARQTQDQVQPNALAQLATAFTTGVGGGMVKRQEANVKSQQDKEKMKSLPPPEDSVDPDGAPTTIVDDSDDEHEHVDTHVVVASTVPEKEAVASAEVASAEVAPAEVESETVEEVKPKKKIIRKKTDA